VVPAKTRIVDQSVGNDAGPVAYGTPDGRSNLAIPEEGLRVGRRINLHRAGEAARDLILVGNSVVDLSVTLVAVKGRRDFLQGVTRQIIIDRLGIK